MSKKVRYITGIPFHKIAYIRYVNPISMIYRFLTPILLLVVLASCGKNNEKPPDQAEDSLSTGWSRHSIPGENFISDIFFVSPQIGYLSGAFSILKTTDGGATWKKVFTNNNGIVNLAVNDLGNCIATSASYDGTLYYNKHSNSGFDSLRIPGKIGNVLFIDASVAYTIGDNFYKSADGGLSWDSIYHFTPMSVIRNLFFTDVLTGWVKTEYGLFKTSSGGTEWAQQQLEGFDFRVDAGLFFWDNNTGYVTDSKNLYKTINGGTSWSKIYTFPYSYHDIHFVSKDIGYISSGNEILKTIDGGFSWRTEVRLQDENILEIHFVDINHGWAGGQKGTLLTLLN